MTILEAIAWALFFVAYYIITMRLEWKIAAAVRWRYFKLNLIHTGLQIVLLTGAGIMAWRILHDF